MNKTIFEALNGASSFLEENGREGNAARLLLQHILQTNYSGLMMKMHDELTQEQDQLFQSYLNEYALEQELDYVYEQISRTIKGLEKLRIR